MRFSRRQTFSKFVQIEVTIIYSTKVGQWLHAQASQIYTLSFKITLMLVSKRQYINNIKSHSCPCPRQGKFTWLN